MECSACQSLQSANHLISKSYLPPAPAAVSTRRRRHVWRWRAALHSRRAPFHLGSAALNPHRWCTVLNTGLRPHPDRKILIGLARPNVGASHRHRRTRRGNAGSRGGRDGPRMRATPRRAGDAGHAARIYAGARHEVIGHLPRPADNAHTPIHHDGRRRSHRAGADNHHRRRRFRPVIKRRRIIDRRHRVPGPPSARTPAPAVTRNEYPRAIAIRRPAPRVG